MHRGSHPLKRTVLPCGLQGSARTAAAPRVPQVWVCGRPLGFISAESSGRENSEISVMLSNPSTGLAAQALVLLSIHRWLTATEYKCRCSPGLTGHLGPDTGEGVGRHPGRRRVSWSCHVQLTEGLFFPACPRLRTRQAPGRAAAWAPLGRERGLARLRQCYPPGCAPTSALPSICGSERLVHRGISVWAPPGLLAREPLMSRMGSMCSFRSRHPPAGAGRVPSVLWDEDT